MARWAAVFLGLFAGPLLGCGSPLAPGPFPSDRVPPSPLANDCPAVGSPFGNGVFYAQDLDSKRACQVYLEQDECVVAIWDDCTVAAANTQRSWEGRIDPVPGGATSMWMRSQSRGSVQPTVTCQGVLELEAERPRALMDCERGASPGYQMYLERVAALPPLGEPLGTLQAGLGSLGAITAFTQSDGVGMVAAVSELAVDQGGGLYLYQGDGTGLFQSVAHRAGYAFLHAATASWDGRWLVVGGALDLFVLDTVSLEVTGHEALNFSGSDSVVGIVMTGANEALVGIRRESLGGAEFRRYQLSPFQPVGVATAIAEIQLVGFHGGGGPSAAVFMFGKRAGKAVVVELDPSTLAELRSFELPSTQTWHVALTPSAEAILFADPRGFSEVRVSTAELRGYYPMPYLDRPFPLAYEPTRNWVLGGGVQVEGKLGAVYAIDRSTGRPVPRAIVTNEPPLAIATLGDLVFAAAGNRIYQVRL